MSGYLAPCALKVQAVWDEHDSTTTVGGGVICDTLTSNLSCEAVDNLWVSWAVYGDWVVHTETLCLECGLCTTVASITDVGSTLWSSSTCHIVWVTCHIDKWSWIDVDWRVVVLNDHLLSSESSVFKKRDYSLALNEEVNGARFG